MRNTIAFQHRLLVTPNQGIDNRNMAMNVQAQLMHYGFMLDQDALKQLGHSDAADIKEFYTEVIDYLKLMTGGQREYRPIYEGFPKQVMDMTECQLWWNQLIGYWSGGSFTPSPWTETKATAFEHVNYKMISAGTEEDFLNIFKKLSQSGTSLVPADLRIIVWFIENYENLVFPENIPFKENLCTVLGSLIASGRSLSTVKLPKLTTTDVLRVIVYLSGGDISLPALPSKTIRISRYGSTRVANPDREKFKFKKFSRKERRMILGILENSNLDIRDMKLKDQRWIRIGEILHPGEYATQYPRSYKAFQRLRDTKVRSWYGEVQAAFDMSFDVGLAKLSERPGEFVRRLDWMLRTNGKDKQQKILDFLSKIGLNVSNKVLFEVYDHFEKRNVASVGRKIMIKGARKHTTLPELPALKQELILAVQGTVLDAIKAKLTILPELGDCWVDEELKKIPLPTNMRSLNDTLVPIVRGQRIPFGTGKKVIRPFVHWYDERGGLDIDLHGYLIGDRDAISFGYNGIRSNNIGCYSGDVRHRRGACAEYVDIIVDEALKEGYHYFLMITHNFQGGSLASIPECVAGVMEREDAQANTTWLPDSITNSMLLKSSARMALIAAYDLRTREYIHLDLDFDNFESYVNGKSPQFFEAISPYIQLPTLSVYDLLRWHVEARGRMVSKETAANHFLYEDFSSSYVKTIEYMGV